MRKKVSLIKTIRLWGILLTLFLTAIICTVDIIYSYHQLNDQTRKTRSEYIQAQKRLIRHEVERVIATIQYERRQCTRLAQAAVKERVNEACSIAAQIYCQNQGKMSDKEIKQQIIAVLKSIHFPPNGYYFILTMEGKGPLLPNLPPDFKPPAINLRDLEGRYIVKEMIKLVKESGEGFYRYTWMKPGRRKGTVKYSFVKEFKPYHWIIGAGLYVDDVEQQVKKRIMRSVNEMRFGTNGYLVICDWQGRVLANGARPELTGRNMWQLVNSENRKITQELIAASKRPNGDYVYYWWKKPGSNTAHPKIAFTKGVPEWHIMVGTGVYLDDIDNSIAARYAALNNQTKYKIIIFIIIALLLVLLIIFLIAMLSNKFDQDFKLFFSSVDQAVSSGEEIDLRGLKFLEFERMARYANKILQDKISAQRSLLTEKEQLKVTLLSINEGVITVDRDGYILLLNESAKRLTAWRGEEAIGKALNMVFKIAPGSKRDNISNLIKEVLQEGTTVEANHGTVLVARNGHRIHISCSIAPLKTVENEICGAVIVFRDITRQLQRENERLQTNKLESIALLAGGIAHNFNNILTGIFGNIELAQAETDPSHSAYKFIVIAHQAITKAKALTRQLLTFAQSGSLVIETIDTAKVIRDAIDFNLSGSNISVELNLPDNLWFIKADNGQINQVLTNLIINAKQAMSAGGKLTITATNCVNPEKPGLVGDYVTIKLSDTGIGIAREHLKKIFDPYFTTKSHGTGLGLATVRSIIRRHNGQIVVESEVGHGTTFTIYLPATATKLHSTASKEDAEADKSSVEVNSAHILIMDDDETILDISSTILSSSGYRVEMAREGNEALEKYRTAMAAGDPFDVVIMDLTVRGGLGGRETMEQLLSIDPKVKAIVASGYSTDQVIANYRQYGFSGCLVKPFKMKLLLREVARVLRYKP